MRRWSVEKAQAWGARQRWFFGANFYPSTAINQLEMWQRETFDPETIERELGFAQGIGMNIMRVYLHDLLWEHDRDGLIERIEQYLAIADAKCIRTVFVIFDDCWKGDFELGPQPEPVPYTHNSGWIQSPGHAIVEDPTQWPRLERYVKELLSHFKDDQRIAVWDLYNEPGNGSDGDANLGTQRAGKSIPLVRETFAWARSIEGLIQPLTVGFWCPQEDMNECVLELSDIISFHGYDQIDKALSGDGTLADKVVRACRQGRPAICTEYLARTVGSTFEASGRYLKEHGVGAINWGLVSGKSQTIYPWGWTAEKGELELCFHDVFKRDGSLLHPEEADVLRELGGVR